LGQRKRLTPEEEKVTKKLRKATWNLVQDYHVIENGDKIMVCLSGGKDSYAMLDVLVHMQKTEIYNFDIVAVNLDQKQPGFPEEVLPNYLDNLGVEYKIVEKDTYTIVKDKTPEGKTTCSLCSRLRRGILYTTAKELGCNKVALGHHRDDIIETLFLNMFFAGKLETMPPKYRTNDGELEVIRPLSYCKEKDIIEFAEFKKFPIIPCNLCGTQEGLQRQAIKQLLQSWDEKYPNRIESIFNSIRNVSPTHLMDKDLHDFETLESKLIQLSEVDDQYTPF
jgi:tRNA 2-thiocytidine biosynthesis protein TtcA